MSYLAIADRLIAYYANLIPDVHPPYGLIAEYLGLKGLVDEQGKIAMKQPKLDCIADAVKLWMNINGNSKWFALYDNYDNPDSFLLRDYLPTALSGKIMITSRIRDCAGLGQGIEVPCFSEAESIRLLLQSSQKLLSSSSADGKCRPWPLSQ